MKLIIGNKNYSSWSMRPWMALKAGRIAFSEEIIWLRGADTNRRLAEVSPNHRVPVLIDGDIVIHESIAILEYAAELAPQLWPSDVKARAYARAVSAEMHAGFIALRNRCQMNIRRPPKPVAMSAAVQADVQRLVAIFEDCRSRFGGSGPFLFGSFTNADAMFAPVVSRFHVYAIPVSAVVRSYMDEMMKTPMWQAWEQGARQETHRIAETDAID